MMAPHSGVTAGRTAPRCCKAGSASATMTLLKLTAACKLCRLSIWMVYNFSGSWCKGTEAGPEEIEHCHTISKLVGPARKNGHIHLVPRLMPLGGATDVAIHASLSQPTVTLPPTARIMQGPAQPAQHTATYVIPVPPAGSMLLLL
jgi:hypothetical protein